MDSNLRLVFRWQDHCPCLGGSCAGLLQGRGVPSGLDGLECLIRKENRVLFCWSSEGLSTCCFGLLSVPLSSSEAFLYGA